MAETVSELMPCPFCGGEAELERDNDHHGEWFNLGCARNWNRMGPDQSCPGGYIWYTAGPEEEAAAIAAWNRRPASPAVVELVEALADLLGWYTGTTNKSGGTASRATIAKARALLAKHAAKP